ncbi:MAG TPA: GDSL-type esterase/lipase family protein [Candidatus Sulfotelmatobacter sp.]|nr:GDSL-type esterase/lipase family protein [Candidatus Sulfotelmatobacter sp.]
MNTNPNAKTVLCFGDSNTHGTKPDRSGRYAVNERWTGLLQKQLGDQYYIIEEGLGGRTTDLEHINPEKPSRNGLVYFKACIDSHMPLDIIIIMLGTNDLKTAYNRSAEDIATALKQYPEYIKKYCNSRNLKLPRIILVSPVYIDSNAPEFVDTMPTENVYDGVSAQKSHDLAQAISEVAEETGCEFIDAGLIATVGNDGLHMDKESQPKLANKLFESIKEALSV